MHLVPARVESLFTCLSAIHEIFDAFLSMDVATISTLPNLFIVRTGYAARALRKLLHLCESHAEMEGKLYIEIRDLKFEEYMNSIIDLLTKVHDETNSTISIGFCMVLKQLRAQGLKSSKFYSAAKHAGSATQQNKQTTQTLFNETVVAEKSTFPGTGQIPAPVQEPYQIGNTNLNSICLPDTFANQQQGLATNIDNSQLTWGQDDLNNSWANMEILHMVQQDLMYDEFGMYGDDGMNIQTGNASWQ